MLFNTHFDLVGKHAFLSASKYHWINYDLTKLEMVYRSAQATKRGTELHEFARKAIELGIKLPRASKTLNMYVNDALGYRMKPEQILYYSDNCFGTADTIAFKRNLLRIHDLKTGENATSINQLMVYAALFCLEYEVKPPQIEMELRIYQSDEIESVIPDPDAIVRIMGKIIDFDRKIEQLKLEEGYGD